MQNFRQIDNLKFDEKSVIDKSNLDQNLFLQNNFLNSKSLLEYYNKIYSGFPLLLNKNDKCFKNKKNHFNIDKNDFAKFIYQDKKFDYLQTIDFFKYGNNFCEKAELKKKYIKIYHNISKHNLGLVKYISSLKKKKLKISSFQTRNIPHFGHELIIKKLLENSDLVIINPVIGPKKKGDFTSYALNKIFNYLSEFKYDRKIIFFPIIANMFYSGPREAMHHIILRERIGFDYFTVGRDHAGTDNFYKKFDAINAVTKHKNKFKIKILIHKGTYYCQKCKKVKFYDQCSHKKSLVNISGSEFRKFISNKEIYEHADIDLQKYIHKLKGKIFY